MSTTPEDHLARVLGWVQPLSVEPLPTSQAHGLVLAEPVFARLGVPPFTNSAMDGYALRHADALTAGLLPVAFDVPAGCAPAALPTDAAARIMTGAMVPAGADTVVKVEDTDQQPGDHPLPHEVRIVRLPALGANIRLAGEDVEPGAEVLAAGTLLDATALSAALSVGANQLSVRRRPRVGVLTTGSELTDDTEELAPGQIPDSNALLLCGLVMEADAEVAWQGRVPDEPDALTAVLAEVAASCDLLVSAGGISAGAFEVVRLATQVLGAEFGHVAMQPGGPQGGGVLYLSPDRSTSASRGAKLPLIALPGNPVSVFVSFHRFVRPALDRLQGVPTVHRTQRALVAQGWRSPSGKVQHLPVRRTEAGLVPASTRGSASHAVASLARAEGIALVPADVTEVRPGDELDLLPTKGTR